MVRDILVGLLCFLIGYIGGISWYNFTIKATLVNGILPKQLADLGFTLPERYRRPPNRKE